MISTDDCWLWAGTINNKGYGTVYIGRFGGRAWSQLAHRALYEFYKGPIPKRLEIDHLCRVPRCVNPDHLEAVTSRENTLRGEGLAAKAAKQTHCLRGHEFNEANTLLSGRGRLCRLCRKITLAERNRKRRERYLAELARDGYL